MRARITAFYGPQIFDGVQFHQDAALVVEGERVAGIVPLGEAPAERVELDGAYLVPGFVDWQVNGGGGVLLNEEPTVEGFAAIAKAHMRFGTTALLPTLITDSVVVGEAAADAAAEAVRREVPGVAGVHFEGPHLSVARKGAHDPQYIRPIATADIERLTRPGLGCVVSTVAVESATAEDIAALTRAGVLVSLGHTAATYEQAMAGFAAGARATTHLFNAMEPMLNREPGLVGAALDRADIYCGLITDGFHVHPAALRVALGTKPRGRMTLVTDAMSTVGSDLTRITLNGRTVTRAEGRLTLEDGTLAGSDLDMPAGIGFTVNAVGVPLGEALRMASLYPAQMLGIEDRHGHLGSGAFADMVVMSEGLEVRRVFYHGEAVE